MEKRVSRFDSHVLEDGVVRLEPLGRRHVESLASIGLDPRIWGYMTREVVDLAGIEAYVEEALRWRSEGTALPFATIDNASGDVVGTTRFAAISDAHLRAEIGWTWIAPSHWRTGINVRAKRMMLAFAFGDLDLRRIEFKTDEQNERSRTAILALGASFEGVFRKHMVRPDGGVRNSAYYSIVDDDWPSVRERLDQRVAQRTG